MNGACEKLVTPSDPSERRTVRGSDFLLLLKTLAFFSLQRRGSKSQQKPLKTEIQLALPSGIRRGPLLVLVTPPTSPAALCPVPCAWRRPGEKVRPAGFQGRWVVWAQPLPRRTQLVRMLLASGGCSVRTRLRPWKRTGSPGPASGVSSAPATLMEALGLSLGS